MLGSRSICCDERQIDVCVASRRKLALCLLGSFPQPLNGKPVLGKVDALQIWYNRLHFSGISVYEIIVSGVLV
jgi:hypothetical protein